MNKTFVIATAHADVGKWDIIKISPAGKEGIIINKDGNPGCITLTVYPYKRRNTKLGRWVSFKILKLKIWLGIIKA